MKLLVSLHLQKGIHIQEPCSIIQPIWCFFHSWLKFTVGLNKVAPVVCDCGPYFMLYFVLCMYFIDFSSKDIKSMPSLHSQARAADLLSIVCSSIQWHVMPKKLLLCAVHRSAVLQTFVAFWSVAVKISFMAVNSLSIRWTSVFLHMTVLPPLILSMSFLNEGCSTKEKDWTSSITNSNISLLTKLWDVLHQRSSFISLMGGCPCPCSGILGCSLISNWPVTSFVRSKWLWCFLWKIHGAKLTIN